MSIKDLLTLKWSSKAKQTSVNNQLFRALYQFFGQNQPITMGQNVSEFIDKGYKYNHYVYSIINLITTHAAAVPLVTYKVTNKKHFRDLKSWSHEARLAEKYKFRTLRYKALEEIEDGKIIEVLNRPNKWTTLNDFVQQAIGFKLITGNTYIYGIGPEAGANAGQIHEMYFMPPTETEIVIGGPFDPIKSYRVSWIGYEDIPAEKVLHIKNWNPSYSQTGEHLYGLSPIEVGTRAILNSNNANIAENSLMANVGAIGILSDEGAALTPEQLQQIERKLKRKAGAHNYGELAAVGAKVTWQSMGMNAVDLNIIESKKMSLRDLCTLFHVNSALLNDPDNKTYNNLKEAKKALYTNAVIPQLDALKDGLNNWYAPKFGEEYYIDFDASEIPELQQDMKETVSYLKDAYWITPNEKRMVMGYDEDADPDMSDYLVPSTLRPLWQASQEPMNQVNPNEPTDRDEPEA